MAAVLKKRALSEFSSQSQTIDDGDVSKKLRLRAQEKPVSSVSPASATGQADGYIQIMRSARNVRDSLQAIANIHELHLSPAEDVSSLVHALLDIYSAEQDSTVRCSIVRLIGRLATAETDASPSTAASADYTLTRDEVLETSAHPPRVASPPDVTVRPAVRSAVTRQSVISVCDQLVPLLDSERSQSTLSQCISVLTTLAGIASDRALSRRLVTVVSSVMRRANMGHCVLVSCLRLLGKLTELGDIENSGSSVLSLLAENAGTQDPRVRAAALHSLLTLHRRSMKLPVSLYETAASAATDDFHTVRETALCLLHVLASTWPEHQVPSSVADDGEADRALLRLVDDAFSHICNAINDLSMRVRVRAATLLGSLYAVSPTFLQQTLDKKLMSNMRRKRSGHERQRELVTAGEWASGRRWADDSPQELVTPTDAALVASGACGAFVHGLEDEYLEVRTATLVSLTSLASRHADFARASFDFVVDMFNDEIESVRVRAISALSQFGRSVALRHDQLDEVLAVLAVFSADTREALHSMLGEMKLPDTFSLRLCVEQLLKNISRYPADRRSVWRCLQRVGTTNAELVEPLAPSLLSLHPYLQQPDADLHDSSYIGLLVLVMNAAALRPAMHALLNESVRRHFLYVRDTLPLLVPPQSQGSLPSAATPLVQQSVHFVVACLTRADTALRATAPTAHQHLHHQHQLLRSLTADLRRLAAIDESVSAVAHCAADLLDARALIWRVISATSGAESSAARHIQALQDVLLRLRYQYASSCDRLKLVVEQLYLRLLCARVLLCSNDPSAAVINRRSLVGHANSVRRDVGSSGTVDGLAEVIVSHQSDSSAADTDSLRRLLMSCLLHHATVSSPWSTAEAGRVSVSRAMAVIYEPQSTSSSAEDCTETAALKLRFTAGLVLGVPLDAEILHVPDVQQVRVRVLYPDGYCHVSTPRGADFRPLPDSSHVGTAASEHQSVGGGGSGCRLRGTVLIYHQRSWSEDADVLVSLVISTKTVADDTDDDDDAGDDDTVPLCEPIRLNIQPLAVRRGAI